MNFSKPIPYHLVRSGYVRVGRHSEEVQMVTRTIIYDPRKLYVTYAP